MATLAMCSTIMHNVTGCAKISPATAINSIRPAATATVIAPGKSSAICTGTSMRFTHSIATSGMIATIFDAISAIFTAMDTADK